MNKINWRLWIVAPLLFATAWISPSIGASSDHIGCVNFECGRTPEPGTIPLMPTPDLPFHLYIPFLVSDDGVPK